jgi:hypothetical protein
MPLPLWSCCISGLGLKGLLHNRTIPVNLPVSSYFGWPLRPGKLCLRETFQAKLYGQNAVSTRCPTTSQHPLEKHVTSSRTYKNQIFFGSRVMHFSGDPSQSSTGSYVLFFKEATCESRTINGLLYAHETLIVARRFDIPRDWLWDACHMAGGRWGSRCEGFRSKEGPHYCFMQSVRNMTINLIHELEIPWGFHPGLYCIA